MIEDNVIDCPSVECGIYLQNVDGARIARNQIAVAGVPVFCKDCENVCISKEDEE